MWYRVFGQSDAEIAPAAVLEHLHNGGYEVSGHFRGDVDGWFQLDLVWNEETITVHRYRADEDGIRNELNSWSAWVEVQEDLDRPEDIMQQIIATQQLITMAIPETDGHSSWGKLCAGLCQFLVGVTQGLYAIDGVGLFDTEGKLLVADVEDGFRG